LELMNLSRCLKRMPFRISKVVGLALLFSVGWVSTGAYAVEPRRPGQESFLTRAVFADGRLWLLSDAGELSNIVEDQDTRTDASLPEPALDLCVRDGHAEAITCTREDCRNWTLRRWIDGKWSAGPEVPTNGDGLVGITCSADRVILVTTSRLIEVARGKQDAVPLSEKLEAGLVSSIHATADHVFLGINAGEWGGGLRRIDRHSGKVMVIERSISGALCGGPLSAACDPVNGIATEPWKPDCIAVAVGLVHFFSHGRIVEVCADQVQRIYFKPYGDQATPGAMVNSDEPFATVAFFGLARVGDELWAAGIDGVYRIKAPGKAQSTPLPKFKRIGNIAVSFDLPCLILVLTTVKQRRSISGSVPLLVPR